MEKFSGLTIGNWEIVDTNNDEDASYEYSEMSINELLNEAGASEEDKSNFQKKYISINIHQLLCEDTLESCWKVINDKQSDKRLAGLNAIVFLLMKPKGKRNKYNQLRDLDKYKALVDFALDNNVPIGFDSCGCENFLKAIVDRDCFKQLEQCAEPCESTLFSTYIDVEGKFFPCSFAPDTPGWEEGIDVISSNDFIKDIWNHPKSVKFRENLISTAETSEVGCRTCPLYDLSISRCSNENT